MNHDIEMIENYDQIVSTAHFINSLFFMFLSVSYPHSFALSAALPKSTCTQIAR